jgi:hypothetical protein
MTPFCMADRAGVRTAVLFRLLESLTSLSWSCCPHHVSVGPSPRMRWGSVARCMTAGPAHMIDSAKGPPMNDRPRREGVADPLEVARRIQRLTRLGIEVAIEPSEKEHARPCERRRYTFKARTRPRRGDLLAAAASVAGRGHTMHREGSVRPRSTRRRAQRRAGASSSSSSTDPGGDPEPGELAGLFEPRGTATLRAERPRVFASCRPDCEIHAGLVGA